MTAVAARYRPNDRVRVRVGSPPGHFRTPVYVQGKTGEVIALCGRFRNPESLAHGGDGLPEQPLYRVRFAMTDLWDDYAGPPGDQLLIDVYEHWLDPE